MAAHGESGKPVDRVAAVCYRRAGESVEFKLIRTRGGQRWTFPKGHIDEGEEPSTAAAREALEEAGIRGRVEPEPFIVFPDEKRGRGGRPVELTIAAYLMLVESDTDAPEHGRDPAWFPAEQAKQRLAQNRRPRYQQACVRVIDKACERLSCPGRGE